MLSVIVPAFNESAVIAECLRHLPTRTVGHEILVVDNGSTDDTATIAATYARVITSQGGRGVAMNAGAVEAHGDVLLFLHADTLLPEGALDAVEQALRDKRVVGGHFAVRFDGTSWQSRVVEQLYRAFRWAGYFYGDSVVFVRRDVFERLGGYRPVPVMEDFDFCLRLRRAGRVARLPLTVVTSSRRWERQSFGRTVTAWLVIQCLYIAGVRRHPVLLWLWSAVR